MKWCDSLFGMLFVKNNQVWATSDKHQLIMGCVEHSNLIRASVEMCCLSSACGLFSVDLQTWPACEQQYRRNVPREDTVMELGYVVWCYSVKWLNVTSAPEGSGIECNTSIMWLCLECTASIRCDLETVFLLRWGCLNKNRNKNCQFLPVCKLELYKCMLCCCVLLLWYQSFLMSLFPIGLSMLLVPVWISFLYCCM